MDAVIKIYRNLQPVLYKPTLCGRNLKNTMNTLRVIEPFFTAEFGDTFTLSEDGKSFVSQTNEEFRKAGESGEVNSSYTSTFSLSPDYAKELIKEGYLEDITEYNTTSEKPFVNIFTEIDSLIKKYNDELSSISEDMQNAPECLKVEKTAVLTNIINVLDHLKQLKK